MNRPTLADAVVIDFETHMDKKAKYTLEKMSTRAYVLDPRFDILSIGIAVGKDEPLFFHKFGRDGGGLDDAKVLLEQAAAAGKWLVAHNTDFDGLILSKAWGVEFKHVFDTIGFLRCLGFAAPLENGARALGREKMAPPIFTERSLLEPETRNVSTRLRQRV